MAFFNRKKGVRELRLPDSSVTFPEIPDEFPNGEEEMISFGQQPKMPLLKPLNDLPSLRSLPPLPSMESLERRMPPSMFSQMQKRDITEIGGPKMEIARKDPVFVKIDRFRDAMSNFEMVKKKLRETSSLLDRIKEGRKSEEEELNRWAEELESIKIKIFDIDKKIFSGLE